MSKDKIQLFEESKVRTHWDADAEKWFLSIVDVIAILTDSKRPRKYWSDLKSKLKKEGSELSEKIGQLKMKSSDGKSYITDVADTEQLFRLIQSIPSKKAEPFKLWLAQIAAERLDQNHHQKKRTNGENFTQTRFHTHHYTFVQIGGNQKRTLYSRRFWLANPISRPYHQK